MKHYFHGGAFLCIATAMVLTSCVDDKYDLDNIDTTTKLAVNDLTLPLNFDAIELQSVIDVDQNDPNATIKIVEVNGEKVYAVMRGGNFEANSVNIAKIEAPAPEGVQDTEVTISGSQYIPTGLQSRRRLPSINVPAMQYTITESTTSFTYEVGKDQKIDPAIEYVKGVKFDTNEPIKIHVTFKADAIATLAEKITIHDMQLIMPQGTDATTIVNGAKYTATNGLLTIPEISTTNGRLELDVVITSADFTKNPQFDSKKGIVVTNGTFDFTEQIGFHKGELYAIPRTGISLTQFPQDIKFIGSYDISAFLVDQFSGAINYSVHMDPISGVDLTDLPDFLAQPGTNLIMENPQLHLKANNPVGRYNVSAETGITINALRDNQPAVTQTLSQFAIAQKGETNIDVLLAPHPTAESVYPDFRGARGVTFPGMGEILAGNGMPKTLEVALSSSAMPDPVIKGEATDFPLQQPIAAISGEYTFYSPLALANGSMIVYSKNQNGWNNSDVDKIEVNKLVIKANATTTLPCSVTLTAYPLEAVDSNPDNDIKLEAFKTTATIAANCTNEPFELVLTDPNDINNVIKNLDGIFFEAIVADFTGKSLSPDQTIRLDNLRVTISGNYVTKF